MPFPSLFQSSESAQEWSVARAGLYGAAIGSIAAMLKTLGPFRAAAGKGFADNLAANLQEIVIATLAFAALCAAASALRNFIARRLIWREFP
jgi:hypothetical protein